MYSVMYIIASKIFEIDEYFDIKCVLSDQKSREIHILELKVL